MHKKILLKLSLLATLLITPLAASDNEEADNELGFKPGMTYREWEETQKGVNLILSGLDLRDLPHVVKYHLENRKGPYRNDTSYFVNELVNTQKTNYLSLAHNPISIFPRSILLFPNLTNLFIGYTQLTELPEEISRMTKLTRLEANNCQIVTLPTSFGQLANLEWIDLMHNRIQGLPESVVNLQKLTYFALRGNPIKKVSEPVYDFLKRIKADIIKQ